MTSRVSHLKDSRELALLRGSGLNCSPHLSSELTVWHRVDLLPSQTLSLQELPAWGRQPLAPMNSLSFTDGIMSRVRIHSFCPDKDAKCSLMIQVPKCFPTWGEGARIWLSVGKGQADTPEHADRALRRTLWALN